MRKGENMPEWVGWFLTIFGLFLVGLFGVTMLGISSLKFSLPLSRLWWVIKLTNFLAVLSSMVVTHLGYALLSGGGGTLIPVGRYIAITAIITFFWILFQFFKDIFENIEDPELFFPR